MKIKKKLVIVFLAVLMFAFSFATVCYADYDDIFESFDGKRIGVQTGTIYVDLVKEKFPNSSIYYFSSVPDEVSALSSHKIDAVYADMPVLRYCASKVDNVKCEACGVSDDYIAIISAKTENGKQYVSEFDKYIAKIKKNGEYDKLVKKWFDGKEEDRIMDDFSTLPNTGKTIKIASEPTFPPFEYVKNGNIIGFEPEIILGFCKEYGYNAEFNNVAFDGIVAGVATGKFDLGVSGFSITEERKKQVDFSDVIFTSGAGVAYLDNGESAGFLSDIPERFKTTFITENRYKMFADGILTTIEITIISILAGTLLGFAIHILCRRGNRIANGITDFVKWLIHGMPVIVFLMILFYIIFGNSTLSGKWVATIGFTLIFACSMIGMLRMGEHAVDEGQYTAAKALGYSDTKAFFKIILPQATQHFLPSYSEQITSHIKATAVVGYIAVVDVTKVGDIIRGNTYDAFFPLIAVAIMYFIIAWVLGLAVKFVSRKTNPKNRNMAKVFKGVTVK